MREPYWHKTHFNLDSLASGGAGGAAGAFKKQNLGAILVYNSFKFESFSVGRGVKVRLGKKPNMGAILV